jgi:arylsulfatase A-like enzyme
MTKIALVVLDTLRKDAFDEYFDWLPGRRFENAWSVSHWTAAVHASLFGGQTPSELGVHKKSEALDIDRPTLAETLREAGFRTKAFSANPYVSKPFRFDRGFDEFSGTWKMRMHNEELFDWMDFISESHTDGPSRYLRALWHCLADDCETIPSLKFGLQVKAEALGLSEYLGDSDDGAAQALRMVQNESYPEDSVFQFFNLMEAHGPYNPPKQYKSVGVNDSPGISQIIRGGDIDPTPLRQAYDDSVNYLSDIYKEIFHELAEDFDYIITLSDHGEMFGEHGIWGHSYGIYPELTHVPLTIYDGTDTKTTCEKPVSLLDVHETILDMAGVDAASDGSSLLGDIEGHACLTEYHGMNTRMVTKLRNDGFSESVIREYDQPLNGIALPSTYYGYGTVDGFRERGETDTADPKQKLKEIREKINVRGIDDSNDEISDSLAQHLEDLGYA